MYNKVDCCEGHFKLGFAGGPWRVQGKGLRGGECGEQVSLLLISTDFCICHLIFVLPVVSIGKC